MFSWTTTRRVSLEPIDTIGNLIHHVGLIEVKDESMSIPKNNQFTNRPKTPPVYCTKAAKKRANVLFRVRNMINAEGDSLCSSRRLSRRWLGRKRLPLRFTQSVATARYFAPARRLPPHSRGTTRGTSPFVIIRDPWCNTRASHGAEKFLTPGKIKHHVKTCHGSVDPTKARVGKDSR